MRNRVMTISAALLLASATFASAQDKPVQTPQPGQQPEVPSAAPAQQNLVDFGFRFTDTTGDKARYERYRDTRNGAYTNLQFGKATEQYVFNASAFNVGYHDQRYTTDYERKNLRFGFVWDSIPLNYCDYCTTPWTESSDNVWTMDTATRQQVQRSRSGMGAVTPLPAGLVSIPQNAAQLALTPVYNPLIHPFDLQSRRDTAAFNLAYDVPQDVTLTGGFTTAHKTGYQPFGMSFAFTNGNELPLHLDNRTNDLSVGLEWVKPEGMFRAGYDYSMFSNKYNEVVWDNPLYATDFNNGLTPPNGPYDPNGYNNGNGPARGRMSTFPDNSMSVVSFTGLYKFTRTSTLNGTMQIIDQNNNDDLIPWTINPVIAQPLVYGAFPNIAELPRTTAEAKVRSVNGLMNFASRLTNKVNVNVRYRHNTHDNLTRPFDATEYVRFDAVPEENPRGESEGHDIVRDTLDAYIGFKVMPFSQLRVGYGYDNFARTGRAHNDMRDQAFRVTWDSTGFQYVNLRALYEHVARRGFGFSEMVVEDGGAQGGLRFYDEADRDRDRVNFIATFLPVDKVDITASLNYMKDNYNGPGMEFGLLDNKNNQFAIGITFMPSAMMDFGASYGRDKYTALQKSRNANPPPDPTWTDPNRDWTLDNDENVNNVDLFFNLNHAVKNTDINVTYTFSDSDNAFNFGGPRVNPAVAGSLAAAGQFLPLPNVTNSWNQLRADVRYFFTPKFGLGFGWWYEKFDVTDFATIDMPGQPGTPRTVYLGEINTGYGNRPYKGNTGTVRLLARF